MDSPSKIHLDVPFPFFLTVVAGFSSIDNAYRNGNLATRERWKRGFVEERKVNDKNGHIIRVVLSF